MAKFCGNIGYAIDIKSSSKGVWTHEMVEKHHTGDILRIYKRYDTGSGINDDINLSIRVSILMNPFCKEHYGSIRYVVMRGTRWKVTDIELNYPRVILSVGGVYNGPIPK